MGKYTNDQIRDYICGWLTVDGNRDEANIKSALNNSLRMLEDGEDGLEAFVERRQKTNEELRLCYVDDCWAYFTTHDIETQWGDDWDDAPYEHNAGEPYTDNYCHKAAYKKPAWEIFKVAFDNTYESWRTPCHGYLNSPWSVKDINRGVVAWLRTPKWAEKQCAIFAGCTLKDFYTCMRKNGTVVYIPYAPHS